MLDINKSEYITEVPEEERSAKAKGFSLDVEHALKKQNILENEIEVNVQQIVVGLSPDVISIVEKEDFEKSLVQLSNRGSSRDTVEPCLMEGNNMEDISRIFTKTFIGRYFHLSLKQISWDIATLWSAEH